MDLDKIWVLDLASQKHHFCQVLSKSVMVGLNPLGDLVWNDPVSVPLEFCLPQ